jgi:streptogramin lyase
MRLPILTHLLALLVGLVYLTTVFILLSYPTEAASVDETTIQVYETTLNPEGSAYELNLGPDGSLWVSDNLAGEIRRYAGDGSQLQVFSGLGAVSDARAGADGLAWYVDQDTRLIARLDPQAATIVTWPLPAGALSGFGTALDGQGRLWVSDFSQPILYRYDPDSMQMCSFDTSLLAGSGSPYLIVDGQSVWLSAFFHNAVMRLDMQTGQLTRWEYYSIYWDFEAEGLAADGAGGLWFADSNHNSLVRLDLSAPAEPRLLRYRLPAGNGDPVMLARLGDILWYSGLTPPALGRLDPSLVTPTIYTPQVDSVVLTADCSTPTASAPEAVVVTSSIPEWSESSYEVLAPAAGWTVLPLESDSFPWGVAVQGEDLWAVDNGQGKLLRKDVLTSLTACKLNDADGDPATSEDQSPLPGWTLYLTLNGQRQPGVLTGPDGCFTWPDLNIGIVTGVEEEQRPGWVALGPTSHDLGPLELGLSYQHSFVNTESVSLNGGVYLPMLLR